MNSNAGKRIVLIGGGHVNCQVFKVRHILDYIALT